MNVGLNKNVYVTTLYITQANNTG